MTTTETVIPAGAADPPPRAGGAGASWRWPLTEGTGQRRDRDGRGGQQSGGGYSWSTRSSTRRRSSIRSAGGTWA